MVRVAAPAARLDLGLVPYRGTRVPLVMLWTPFSTRTTGGDAAGWSRAIATKLLRRELGFQGVTITDSLDGAANARRIAPNGLAIAAANAGTDLILLTGGEVASRNVFTTLLQAAQRGRVHRSACSRRTSGSWP